MRNLTETEQNYLGGSMIQFENGAREQNVKIFI